MTPSVVAPGWLTHRTDSAGGTALTERSGGWLQTYSGKKFWPLDARPSDIHIVDIAHALALTTRFGGHCRQFYSVAQHSVYVSRFCKPENALWGLLHDATEAYLGDIPRPLKHGPGFGGFHAAEATLEQVVAQAFLLPWPVPKDVKEADRKLLWTEKRDITLPMPRVSAKDWGHGSGRNTPIEGLTIVPVPPWEAEAQFLARYTELMNA